MADFMAQWFARSSVMVPVVVVTAGLAWWILTWLGVMKRGAPLNGADMRTWPFYFAIGDAAVFALVFGGIAAWMGDSSATVPVAAGVAAVIAVGVGALAGRSPSAK
jgi:hypothetical protein